MHFFQFSTPMVFLGVPVVFNIVEVAFHLVTQAKWLGDAQLLLLCLYSLVNAAVTLAFVAPYRNYTIQQLKAAAAGGLFSPPTNTSPVMPLQNGGGSLKTTRVNT
jgi:hypothetical protein